MQMPKSGSLHISIVSYNTRADLLACIRSIEGNPPSRKFRITVVDNGSSDGSVDEVREQFPDVSVVESGENLGYGRANNLALMDTKADFVAVLNSDLIVHPGSLDKCCEYLAQHPECGIVGGGLLEPGGKPQMNWGAGELNVWSVICEQFFLSTLFPKSPRFNGYFLTNWDHQDTRALPQVCGALMVMPSKVYKDLGGFSPNYWMYCEDTDICARTRRLGLSCVYLHNATATHHHGISSQGALRPRMVLEHNVSRCIYLMKFYGRDQAQRARRVMIIGSLMRVVLWGMLGLIKKDRKLIDKGRGYIGVLYGTRRIKV
jgi:GT2 family glycosyltransferase